MTCHNFRRAAAIVAISSLASALALAQTGPALAAAEHPVLVNVYWGAYWQTPEGIAGRHANNQFVETLAPSDVLPVLAARFARASSIQNGQYLCEAVVDWEEPNGATSPAVIDDSQVEEALERWVAGGSVPANTPHSVYNVFLPRGFTLSRAAKTDLPSIHGAISSSSGAGGALRYTAISYPSDSGPQDYQGSAALGLTQEVPQAVSAGSLPSASVAFDFSCSLPNGFVMAPNQHARVGYITDFTGLGSTVPLVRDLKVNLPFKPTYPQFGTLQSGPPFPANVVGVIESFTWAGGVSDPVRIDFYVSHENATQLYVLGLGLKNTAIQAMGWWIGAYDLGTSRWFEEAKPWSSPTLKATVKQIAVDLTPVAIQNGVNVYKVSITIVPQTHRVSTLWFDLSPVKTPVIKTWGQP